MLASVVRLSGIALIAGAGLLGVAIVIVSFNPVVNRLLPRPVSLLLLLAAILLLLSVPAMYAQQARAAGWLGLAGYTLLQSGLLVLVVVAAPPLLYPSLDRASGENIVVFLLGIALVVGLLLTGIATIQARVYPQWAGMLLLAATAGFFFVFFVAEFLPPMAGQIGSACFGVVLAAALAWIGATLWLGAPALAT